jgi:hypothetical protein
MGTAKKISKFIVIAGSIGLILSIILVIATFKNCSAFAGICMSVILGAFNCGAYFCYSHSFYMDNNDSYKMTKTPRYWEEERDFAKEREQKRESSGDDYTADEYNF